MFIFNSGYSFLCFKKYILSPCHSLIIFAFKFVIIVKNINLRCKTCSFQIRIKKRSQLTRLTVGQLTTWVAPSISTAIPTIDSSASVTGKKISSLISSPTTSSTLLLNSDAGYLTIVVHI